MEFYYTLEPKRTFGYQKFENHGFYVLLIEDMFIPTRFLLTLGDGVQKMESFESPVSSRETTQSPRDDEHSGDENADDQWVDAETGGGESTESVQCPGEDSKGEHRIAVDESH
ncbi:hypothetical protein SAMN04487950_0717 [Halogranum rubrum]|uniref:Uncharacterized protein n=1 Tax=Halogranum rubrum TaxID=553466 RepID=A0A1I4BQW9_9EURY|nr:hypothetical protein SAMN04487950_0717 [Halogranum rubrum]